MNNEAKIEESNRFDLPDLNRSCNVDQVFYEHQIESTNDWAIKWANDPGNSPAVLTQRKLFLTSVQTAGRGRGSSLWLADEGSLTFSILMPSPFELQDRRRMWLPLAVGCGICDSVAKLIPGIAIKWPNDIYVGESKLGGVLVESTGQRIVIGCGLNVNNDVEDYRIQNKTSVGNCTNPTSVLGETGRPWRLTWLLGDVVNAVLERVDSIELGSDSMWKSVNSRDWLRGRPVGWNDDGIERAGNASGISKDGGLIIETINGLETIHSGSIRTIKFGEADDCGSFES